MKYDADYGGTYGVSGVAVYNYGGALNEGKIIISDYTKDREVFNTGMYLAENTATEAFIRNNGIIEVNGKYSTGMRSDSGKMADATNYGDIKVSGEGSVGMAVINEYGVIYNGRPVSEDNNEQKKLNPCNNGVCSISNLKKGDADIFVDGKNSFGMFS